MNTGDAIRRFVISCQLENVVPEIIEVYRQELEEFGRCISQEAGDLDDTCAILYVTDDQFTDAEQDCKLAMLRQFLRFLWINGWAPIPTSEYHPN